jgi:hypothetical protein
MVWEDATVRTSSIFGGGYESPYKIQVILSNLTTSLNGSSNHDLHLTNGSLSYPDDHFFWEKRVMGSTHVKSNTRPPSRTQFYFGVSVVLLAATHTA